MEKLGIKKLGKQSMVFINQPIIKGYYSIVGKKEGERTFADYYDYILKDDTFGEKSYEKAEQKMLEHAIFGAIDKAKLTTNDVDIILCGDLMNQITSSSFAARQFDKPFLGLYSACSTMVESLILGAMLIDGGYANNVVCATTSHFSSSEKQFRYPLELGNQRPPQSQWTVTGSGATLISNTGKGVRVTMATVGKIVDLGVTDANNMGSAMSPATISTLIQHFEDTNTTPNDYDAIFTGDLGKLGEDIVRDLMEHNGWKLGKNYADCGHMIYTDTQKTNQGGSGCGCSASILNSYVCSMLEKGKFKKVLFLATGALLSPIYTQQGNSIPGIAHAIVLECPQNK